jgi:hypothetical protein
MYVPDSKNPKPSWYGESVGHYCRTPHTVQMQIVERWKIIEGGNPVEVSMTVEYPSAFTTAWSATQHWRKVHQAR